MLSDIDHWVSPQDVSTLAGELGVFSLAGDLTMDDASAFFSDFFSDA
jgi:hypothetical protein